jgi:hypothetical protein
MPKIASVALPFCVLLASCGCSHTYSTPDGAVTVKQTGKESSSYKVTGKDGQVSMDFNTGKEITGYPADAPIYKGAKAVMDIKADEKHARNLSLESTDSADRIAAFYKEEFDSKGWKVDATIGTPQMTMYTATKDNRQMMVQIAPSGSKTAITQIIADKK